MLNELFIQNFTIIDQLSIQFKANLSTITGETGAGKSIIVEALQLICGARADSQMIRTNQNSCDISANFSIENFTQITDWLKANDFASESECLIRRIIKRDGNSKNSINGIPCNLSKLKELGGLLMSIHSQHQQLELLTRDFQSECLDDFANCLDLSKNLKKAAEAYFQVQNEIKNFKTNNKTDKSYLDLLSYQLEELNQLNLQAGELDQLHQQFKKLHAAENFTHDIAKCLDLLKHGDHSIEKALFHTQQLLEKYTKTFPEIKSSIDFLSHAQIQLAEASDEIQTQLDSNDLDEENLTFISARLEKIHEIARKHKIPAELLAEKQIELSQTLARLSNADQYLENLNQALIKAEKNYQTLADQLSTKRKAAAKPFEKNILDKIQLLGMPKAKFVIEFIPTNAITSFGNEQIEFMLSANPGQALGPLNRVASGGELSRIALAIYVTKAKHHPLPTLIFDEVDVGISGGVAEIVGKLLAEIGQNTQVFCITHLAQVAVCGKQHLRIEKISDKKTTKTQVLELDQTARTEEIARLLAGIQITEQSRLHAKEMLAGAVLDNSESI